MQVSYSLNMQVQLSSEFLGLAMFPLSATGTDFSSFCTEEQFGCIEMTVVYY